MEKYFRHRVKIDWTVAVLAGIAFVVSEKIGFYSATASPLDHRNFLKTATIADTLLGFSLASERVLISHKNSQGMEFLRRSKSFSQLISLLSSALWRFFALAIISMLGFVSHSVLPTLSLGVYIAVCSAAVFSATALIWSVAAIVRLTQ